MSLPVFPSRKVKWNSVKTPDFNTTSVILGRGRRKSITNRAYPKWTIDVQFTGLKQREYEEIIGFLCNVGGGSFLWLDHEDNRQINAVIAQGNGTAKNFQMIRTWGVNNVFYEPITDIIPETLRVYVNEQYVNNYTLNENGILTFNAPPTGIIRADFMYYWRVALDDSVDFTAVYRNFYETGSLKFITV